MSDRYLFGIKVFFFFFNPEFILMGKRTLVNPLIDRKRLIVGKFFMWTVFIIFSLKYRLQYEKHNRYYEIKNLEFKEFILIIGKWHIYFSIK